MRISIVIGLLINLMFIGCSPKISATTTVPKTNGKLGPSDFKNIDWELYDPSSTIPKNEIQETNLQGLWKAYQGAFRFGDNMNTMNLNQPFIIEFKNGTYRRNTTDKFHSFTLKDNTISCNDEDEKDLGFINQISSSVLTITWKIGSNYTRYYYKK